MHLICVSVSLFTGVGCCFQSEKPTLSPLPARGQDGGRSSSHWFFALKTASNACKQATFLSDRLAVFGGMFPRPSARSRMDWVVRLTAGACEWWETKPWKSRIPCLVSLVLCCSYLVVARCGWLPWSSCGTNADLAPRILHSPNWGSDVPDGEPRWQELS